MGWAGEATRGSFACADSAATECRISISTKVTTATSRKPAKEERNANYPTVSTAAASTIKNESAASM